MDTERLLHDTVRMAEVASVSRTPGEAAMVPLLRQLLEEGGEFRKAGGALRLLPVPGDAWARQAVMA
ncbi:MAG: hypothetical protein NUV35_09890, partial [Syntrophomonadaceae bacterium]|nr:hypothetical protein [Syntrophomonadaceae bacterium]